MILVWYKIHSKTNRDPIMSAIMLPEQLAISHASQHFDDDGKLTNEHHNNTLTKIVSRLIKVTSKIE